MRWYYPLFELISNHAIFLRRSRARVCSCRKRDHNLAWAESEDWASCSSTSMVSPVNSLLQHIQKQIEDFVQKSLANSSYDAEVTFLRINASLHRPDLVKTTTSNVVDETVLVCLFFHRRETWLFESTNALNFQSRYLDIVESDWVVQIEIDLPALAKAIRDQTGIDRALQNLPNQANQSRPLEAATTSSGSPEDEDSLKNHIRRKHTGGLRLNGLSSPKATKIRRLNAEGKTFPQRRKPHNGDVKMEPASIDKLIRGIWEQIHGSLSFDLKNVVS